MKQLITGSQIEARFLVNPETGEIRRSAVGSRYQPRLLGYIKPGDKANDGGYRMLSVPVGDRKYVRIRAHHLIWAWVHGGWPRKEIDHINGNRDDNRISNLRLASIAQNRTNKTKQSNNKSGYKWVYWCNQTRRWRAEIAAPISMGIGRKRLYYSLHKTPKEAHEAACSAARNLHGEFFNSGLER